MFEVMGCIRYACIKHVYLCYNTQLTENTDIDNQQFEDILFVLFIASMTVTNCYNMTIDTN